MNSLNFFIQTVHWPACTALPLDLRDSRSLTKRTTELEQTNKLNKEFNKFQTLICIYQLWTSTVKEFFDASNSSYYKLPNFNVRAKRAICFELSVWHFVCPSHAYGHTPLQILVKFTINVLGTKTERRMCTDFSYPSRFKLVAVVWVFIAVRGIERGLLFTEILVFISFTTASSKQFIRH